MEAYLHGVSTRKVDDLVQALGVASGISKSEVSRICAELDDLARRRFGLYPYFLAACSIAGAAFPKSSGVITGWTWMVAPKPRNRGSASAGI